MLQQAMRHSAAVLLAVGYVVATPGQGWSDTIPQPLRADVQVRKVMSTQAAAHSIRIVKDPRDNTLYYAKRSGPIYRVDLSTGTSVLAWGPSAHGLGNVQGMAIDARGTIYLSGNADVGEALTRATIKKGVLNAVGKRVWSVLAQTEGYPKSNTPYDHRINGIVVSPNGDSLYVNSGSRTDHGEVQDADGLSPRLRETGLTACILKLPVSASNLLLRNDRRWLKDHGYIYAEGTRNSFDLALAPNGDVFGTENGPSSDASEELNWLRPGRHYGFPWRFGGIDNPQQFPAYNPSKDKLLNPIFDGVAAGYWQNDPTFPSRPAIPMVQPIRNLGPAADKYRDPVDGLVKDAGATGEPMRTFTSHRSPLGLVFDRALVLSPEFRGHGFMLSWNKGDPAGDSLPGPFKDAGQDLLHLVLAKAGGDYTLHATRIVAGFNNPVDAEIIGNKIYVLEYGGTQGIWEVTLPKG